MSKSTDTDDVLSFINSLPDSKSGTPKPGVAAAQDDNEDFMDFLDELAAHDKSKPSTPVPKVKSFEPKKRQDDDKNPSSAESAPVTASKPTETVKGDTETLQNVQETGQNAPESKNASEELEIDPIGSISSWWNNEGATKVSSLWGSIASNAQTISETTYQLASNTTNQLSKQRQNFLSENNLGAIPNSEEILNISDRLNVILTTMSNQIKDGLISQDDELLNILLVYDLDNWTHLDRACYDKFSRVMGQVEGGIKVTVNNFNHKHDREAVSEKTDLNMFYGKIIDGEKLCFANLDSSIKDYLKITGVEEEAKKKDDSPAQEVEINKSNLFISLQPITSKINADDGPEEERDGPILIEAANNQSFAFTLILKDITNNITIVTKTQPFPLKWSRWLLGDTHEFKKVFGEGAGSDEVDPGEWVREWVTDGLALSFGVLAQEYVTKRMGL